MPSLHPSPSLAVRAEPGRPPTVVVDPSAGAADRWVGDHRAPLRATLEEHGAVLLRGLEVGGSDDVAALLAALDASPVEELEGFAPRTRHAAGVYSSSVWPANQPMCMHHELSYRRRLPGLLVFACVVPPAAGGATGVADAAAVLESLPADLVDRFERQGWVLTRSYHDEIGATVAEAFGTDDRGAVEAYCREQHIAVEWQPDGSLRTRQHRAAVVRHPRTGRRCWFNQVAFLNQHTLDPEVREFLIEVYGPEALPFDTRYGDGEPVGADVVELLNATYDAHTRREPWRAGDVLLVDNVRTAHSREAYQGDRQVLVGMGDPVGADR